MSFPQFRDKHQFDALISPGQVLDYERTLGLLPEGPSPERVILCYQGAFFKRAVAAHGGRWSSGPFRRLYWLDGDRSIALGQFGIGAPVAALMLELLIAWGVRDFISIGTAGAIAPDLQIGDLVGCDRAIRDEGTSHHYAAMERYSHPTDGGRFAARFPRVGTSWTLDAIFRHTREEIAAYQSEGVLTVEMEASALFAVARLRGVRIGAGFVISDLLSGEAWAPHLHSEAVARGLDRLLQLALD